MSNLLNFFRVLATAPSHAAVDALTLAILRQWNEEILGYPSTKLIRIGNALRLSGALHVLWFLAVGS